MAGSSTLDALIAEMLGDVGKLHDELQSLKEALPAFTNEAEAKLSTVVGSVVEVTNSRRAETAAHVNAAKADAAKALEGKAHELANWYAAEIGKAATKAATEQVGAVIEQASAQLEQAAASVRAAAGQYRASLAQKLLLVLACSALAGAFGGAALQLTASYWKGGVSAEDAAFIESGKAISAAWPKLDAATRKRITELSQQK